MDKTKMVENARKDVADAAYRAAISVASDSNKALEKQRKEAEERQKQADEEAEWQEALAETQSHGKGKRTQHVVVGDDQPPAKKNKGQGKSDEFAQPVVDADSDLHDQSSTLAETQSPQPVLSQSSLQQPPLPPPVVAEEPDPPDWGDDDDQQVQQEEESPDTLLVQALHSPQTSTLAQTQSSLQLRERTNVPNRQVLDFNGSQYVMGGTSQMETAIAELLVLRLPYLAETQATVVETPLRKQDVKKIIADLEWVMRLEAVPTKLIEDMSFTKMLASRPHRTPA